MNAPAKLVPVSIVIPVYRGAETIGPLVDLLVESLRPYFSFEIILVNDCSPDNSERICRALYTKHKPHIKFCNLAKNVGEHNAVMAGLNFSTGDWVVIMDDDFQNPVSEVLKLLSYAVASTYDAVYTHYDAKKHPIFRNLGSRFNDRIATVMLKKPKDLYLSSFKAMNRFLVDEIIKYELPFPYIDGLVLRTTSNIGKLQVRHCERASGESGYTLKKLVSLWLSSFTNFSIIPLRISTTVGFIFAALGFLVGIEMFVERMLNPSLPVGYALIIFLVTVFAGTQLIAIGMVGEYVGRIFLCQNKKPQYCIRNFYGNTVEEFDNGKK
jgi:undecaprenyl-phosphate 4-deoxy-4-formamido-L-arabinose transferase